MILIEKVKFCKHILLLFHVFLNKIIKSFRLFQNYFLIVFLNCSVLLFHE